MGNILNAIVCVPLGYVMYWCLKLFGNYGVSIIVFTLISKIILFPLSLWVQKNSIKMVKVKPELNEFEAKYIHDKDKFFEKQNEIYKREKYNPFAGLIPLLIQIPLILGLINVIYNPLRHLLHIDKDMIASFEQVAMDILDTDELGSSGQLQVAELVCDDEYVERFLSVSGDFSRAETEDAIESIRGLDMNFLTINLAEKPSVNISLIWLIPILAGLSSWIMCYIQNKINVLQIEQGFWGKWGMAIFLTAFSLYFGFAVSAGVGLYWTASNAFSTAQLFLLNAIYDPKKYIDYERLESSKELLKKAKEELPKRRLGLFDNSPEAKRERLDYKRFMSVPEEDMKIVFYSEQSGFYKYYKGFIEEILRTSDQKIHYVTSDSNDAVFSLNNDRIIPYYIGETKLITLMMKITADVVVMTMPDLQNYHIKRSLVRKDVKYVYVPHGLDSINLTMRTGSVDHYDVILCVGQHMVDEIRETEQVYGLPKKKLIKCGYPLLDDMIAGYENSEHIPNEKKTVMIAPSWQPDNIVDSCLDEILSELSKSGYRIIVRPHPQHIRHRGEYIGKLKEKYSYEGSDIEIQTDFSSNSDVFNADLLITDWSGIAFEYAYTTKRPVLFINTPMKVMNEEYQKIPTVPLNILLRSEIGKSLDTDKLDTINALTDELLENSDMYARNIESCLEKYVFHLGESSAVGARNILKQIRLPVSHGGM